MTPQYLSALVLVSPLLAVGLPQAAWAQSIEAHTGDRSTNTQVTQTGNRFDINGGVTSGDGDNLFHNFEQFGLTAGQVANFITPPATENVVGSILGGPSHIDGRLQVSGSSANLYLLNPAGIVFGPNAALNLDGAFTAATSTGLGFGQHFFDAFSTQDYSLLTNSPTSFLFTDESPGAIVNAGDLAVDAGQHITLLGGSVINTGTLTAPEGGTITVAAVPGQNQVRISQDQMLLSLRLETLPGDAAIASTTDFSPVTLPELLTGAPQTAAELGVAVSENGTVSLVRSATSLPDAAGLAAVNGTLNASGAIAGEVTVVGDRVALIDATVNASGTTGGGTVRLGGDLQGGEALPAAQRTYVDSASAVTADAVGSGDGGTVIIWANDATQFDGLISARGGQVVGNGGFVEVSGQIYLAFDGTVNVGASQGVPGTLLLDPRNITIANTSSLTGVDGSLPDILRNEFGGSDIVISATALQSQTGNIILEANNDIRIANGINLMFVNPGGSITFTADADGDFSGSFLVGDAATPDTLIAPAQTITTSGRDITVTGASIVAGNINSTGNPDGGNVTLQSTIDNVVVGYILSTGSGEGNGKGGNINVNANRLFRATSTIDGENTELIGDSGIGALSVASTGNTGTDSKFSGGTIDIDHGGDSFVVGAELSTTVDENGNLIILDSNGNPVLDPQGNPVSPSSNIFLIGDNSSLVLAFRLTGNFAQIGENTSGTAGAILSRVTNGRQAALFVDEAFDGVIDVDSGPPFVQSLNNNFDGERIDNNNDGENIASAEEDKKENSQVCELFTASSILNSASVAPEECQMTSSNEE